MNPFSTSPDPPNDAGDSPAPVTINNSQEKRWLAVRRPHPSVLPPPIPLARKRGWQPSSPEPSPAAAVTASTCGHVNVPPKYRDFTVTPEAREEEEVAEEMEAEFPPAKRRRTLAGSIVSGAVNAALIGTAVGFTVYRLWRDRGRVPELEPPPYEQGDWVPSEPDEAVPPANATATTPRSKRTRTVPNTVRRGTNRHRKARNQTKLPVSSPGLSRHSSPIKPEFDFGSQMDQGDELEDKMDWMGDRLARLIEDGKKALGKEVVVMSEAQEDEEDDGSGNWEEEANLGTSSGRASRSGSIRRKDKSQALPGSTSYASPPILPPPAASPRRQQFSTVLSSHSSSALPIPGRSTHSTVDTVRSYHSFREQERQWQSPELRESMERARAAYLRDRQ